MIKCACGSEECNASLTTEEGVLNFHGLPEGSRDYFPFNLDANGIVKLIKELKEMLHEMMEVGDDW